MSQLLIHNFLADLDRIRAVSGSTRETVVREAFKDLLKAWAKQHDLVFIPEFEVETPAKEKRYVDGALLYSLRVPFGYWEAKDEKDDLDAEIETKKRRGYPQDNIIFEDSRTAVLIQNRTEVIRAATTDTKALERLLILFFEYERPEIAQFHKAVEQFKADLPAVIGALRQKIETASKSNPAFAAAETKFLDHARETINPAVTAADVREMLIQHILTEDIFARVFDDDEFHRKNNIAKELYALEERFFTGAAKKDTLKQLEPYYAAIRTAASQIPSHAEKQTFLKVIYENFYKVYNPKAADRLGVIYTPNEIVRFMIESADWLCEKHFGKNLIDAGVEILDPATGTGTFICELLEHFRGQREKLAYKYKEELHANEVAILPYYVANLNIEATYAAITGQYAEYPNLCFVDTLDNVGGLGKFSGYQEDMFGAMSDENVARIKRQNARKISVIIGNPPYNANQQNENDNNKNREYRRIDERIKATYIKESTAQKTKLYDMYARFFRWASDRIKDEGIIAFVSNNSFVDSRTFDGFRKIVARDFSEIWIVDLKGNARTSGERRRQEAGNIFADQIRVGVAVYFCVKHPKRAGCRLFYEAVRDYAKSDEKQDFLTSKNLSERQFKKIKPAADGRWIDQSDNDFDSFIQIASKATKAAETKGQERAVFKLESLGVVTARDEWAYEFDKRNLEDRVTAFAAVYEQDRIRWYEQKDKSKTIDFVDRSIKWTSELESYIRKNAKISVEQKRFRDAHYRPFIKQVTYYDKIYTHRIYRNDDIFPIFLPWNNKIISYNRNGIPCFWALAANTLVDYHFSGDSVVLALFRYASDGTRLDNITDWALVQFRGHYGAIAPPISKDSIFHYVYGVLHDPIYREKYALNLKREFPRIPFYPDFWRWAEWGEKLMDLHIGYETVEPWPLKRTDTKDEKAARADLPPKAILKAHKDHGLIVLDSETQLSGVPATVWDYHLGNRSGLEWILDQYKERTPKDPTIREKFNTYRFADYKEKVIDLLRRVTRVSVETMVIVEAMKAAKR